MSVRRTVLLLVLTPALVALAGCPAPPPWEFVSKEHKFRVRFGSEPEVFDQPDAFLSSKIFTVKGAHGSYTVRTYALPITPDAAARESEKLLSEARADLLRSVGGTETAGEPIALAGKYPGRAFTASAANPPGVLRARVYLVGTRLYKVSVFGTADYANAREADAFLESFMILE